MTPEILSRFPAFRALGQAECAALLAGAREIVVPPGALVMAKGEAADRLALLLEGRLKVSAASVDGRMMTFRLVEPPDLVGEVAVLDGGVRSADVSAVLRSRLLLIPAADCRAAVRAFPAVAEAMLRLLCARLRDTSDGLERLATQRLPVRLAHLLLRLGREFGRPGADGAVQLPMRLSQEEVGAMVAATREAVNKQLRQWQAEGLLDIAGGRVVLRRPAALAALLEG
jgi:CRP-like cAMP-binding protein